MTVTPDSGWIVDASVAVKWFMPSNAEPDSDLARKLPGRLPLKITSLGFYEVGNVLTRAAGWEPEVVASALDLVLENCGPPVSLSAADFKPTAEVADEYGITFYDASYFTIAQRLNRAVVSADADLLKPGLAVDLRTVLRI